jgi:hypothetical protein
MTPEWLLADSLYRLPLRIFTNRINDYILRDTNATAYYWNNWDNLNVRIAISVEPPYRFYEAVSKVLTGEVEKIHFNLDGILEILGVNSYSDFIEDGNWSNYNISIPEEDRRHTAHEMFFISENPILCDRTIFYDGYNGNIPRVSPTAKNEICGG